MIEIRNLTKLFKHQLIWRDLNFTVELGENLAIIGRSGSGKSVLLKHINALLRPNYGEVIIDGYNIYKFNYNQLKTFRRRFGVLFQDAALFDSMTTFNNVAFPLRFFTGISETMIKKKVLDTLKVVELHDVSDKYPSDLSGGMRKRVGLARAIIMKPRYILYDEPTSGLDPQTAQEINKLILNLTYIHGITSIIVTHDVHSVLNIAHRVMFLNNKKIEWMGTVNELKNATFTPLLHFLKANEYNIPTDIS